MRGWIGAGRPLFCEALSDFLLPRSHLAERQHFHFFFLALILLEVPYISLNDQVLCNKENSFLQDTIDLQAFICQKWPNLASINSKMFSAIGWTLLVWVNDSILLDTFRFKIHFLVPLNGHIGSDKNVPELLKIESEIQ